jgi:peptidoglycan LD-endopeptidase LytH
MSIGEAMGVHSGRVRWMVAAVAVAALAWAPAAWAAVDDDPAVREAREQARRARELIEDAERGLERQRETLGAVSADLDRAAAAYEHANAHHQRLLDERGGSQAKVDAAVDASAAAREAFASYVAGMYRQGPLELRLSEFVLAADSHSAALHRVGLFTRMSQGSVRRMAGATRVVALAADDDRQHEVVTVGTEASAATLRLRSDELTVAMQAAEQRVRSGERTLADAEADVVRADREVEAAVETVRRRLEDERIARIAAEELASRGHRLPPVDGKVCPVGAPHGFGDSWHAPRPGGRKHLGVDMFAVHGMPLYAVTEGTVRVSSNRLGGLVVHLDADDGDRYYYAHLSAVSVSSGDRVAAGDIVGANGNTGNARTTPPHLHWQYHPGGGAPVNPYPLARALCR